MILRYLKAREWALVGACAALITLQVWLDLEIPDYMYAITTLIQTGGSVAQVMDQGWPMLACALGSLLTALAVGCMAAYIAASLAKR
ncbi:MAG TPA: ABC transporter ATP-binding protein, partial [Methanomassiliicoccales archaeon]|nr:ABC transporter ATP-binding protein [Methanomassiliicoccales archaeon]